ncbi:MAG: hypothetical protein RL180_710 [Pseudomonadota bacterium]
MISVASPMIAIPISVSLCQELKQLNQRLQAGEREPLANDAGRLISDVACATIDTIFGDMLKRMADASGKSSYQDAQGTVEEVKAVLRKYLPWATGFFGNERLMPVAQHYDQLLVVSPQDDAPASAYLTFAISAKLAEQSLHSLEQLRTGQATTARAAIDVLILVIEESLVPLLYTPKKLLKFNFVADKTLNGVISMTNSLAFRQLRKLGDQLEPTLFVPVADHLQQFLRLP